MGRELVTKAGRFYCVSLEPDICKTPVGPSTHAIPYTIKGEFSEATGVSTNITSNMEQVVIHASTVIPTVTGDEKGTAKGIKSKTVGKRVQHDQKSSTVSFNGERAIRVGDSVFMNDKNTTGKVLERPASPPATDQTTHPGAAAFPAPPLGAAVAGQGALQRMAAALSQAVGSAGFIPASLLNRVPGVPKSSNPGKPAAEKGEGGSTANNGTRAPVSVAAGTDGGSSRGHGGGAATGSKQPLVQQPRRPISSTTELRQEFPDFPVWAGDILMKSRVKVWRVQDSVVEAFPQLKGVWPRGYPADETYDHVGGVCLDDGSAVAIATSDRYPSKSFDMPFHELAHAVDIAGMFSRSEQFITAWGKDYEALRSNYFRGVRSGHAEAFAEGFARYYRGDSSTKSAWPNISRYFKELDACMASGMTGC
jgi:hypothetical protein